MQNATQQVAATNNAGVIRPNFGNPSNAPTYHPAGFASEVKDATDYNGLVEQATNEIEEYDAVVALATHLAASLQKVEQHASALKQKVETVKLEKLAAMAKELGLGTLLDAATKQQSVNKGGSTALTTSTLIPKTSVSGAPKVYKYVLSDPAAKGADDPPGYKRLPNELRASGKYRLATTDEIKQMQADRHSWEAKHGPAKKP